MKLTPEEIEAMIIELWKQDLTGSQIAKRLGVSRCSVLGKVYRMRQRGILVKNRAPARSKKYSQKPEPKNISEIVSRAKENLLKKPLETKPVAALPKTKITVMVERLFDVYENGKTLMQLTPSSCRYIVSGDNESPVLYCGKNILRHSVCADHLLICRTPPRSKSRSAWEASVAREKAAAG